MKLVPCLNHTIQKDSRGELGTSFQFGPTLESLEIGPSALKTSLTAKEAVLSPDKKMLLKRTLRRHGKKVADSF